MGEKGQREREMDVSKWIFNIILIFMLSQSKTYSNVQAYYCQLVEPCVQHNSMHS